MANIQRMYPGAKGKMSVSPVCWIPGSLSASLPFFAMPDPNSGVLTLRADDPNLQGVQTVGLTQSPVVEKATIQKPANKGQNFYSAPWSIPTLPARDLNRRVEVTSVDSSITDYITALQGLIGAIPVTLTDWQFEQKGQAKAQQILQGSVYQNVTGTTQFGGTTLPNTQVAVVAALTPVATPLITNDFTFNGTTVTAQQMPQNTFYAIDTPIVISAVDSANSSSPRIQFTLLNNVTLYNGPNQNG